MTPSRLAMVLLTNITPALVTHRYWLPCTVALPCIARELQYVGMICNVRVLGTNRTQGGPHLLSCLLPCHCSTVYSAPPPSSARLRHSLTPPGVFLISFFCVCFFRVLYLKRFFLFFSIIRFLPLYWSWYWCYRWPRISPESASVCRKKSKKTANRIITIFHITDPYT